MKKRSMGAMMISSRPNSRVRRKRNARRSHSGLFAESRSRSPKKAAAHPQRPSLGNAMCPSPQHVALGVWLASLLLWSQNRGSAKRKIIGVASAPQSVQTAIPIGLSIADCATWREVDVFWLDSRHIERPAICDGSKSREESIRILKLSRYSQRCL